VKVVLKAVYLVVPMADSLAALKAEMKVEMWAAPMAKYLVDP